MTPVIMLADHIGLFNGNGRKGVMPRGRKNKFVAGKLSVTGKGVNGVA